MSHTLGIAVLLAGFWIVLSGHYTPLMLAFGGASLATVVWFARRMDIVDHEARALHLGRRALLFWGWLGVQILLSSWDVSRRIWTGRPLVRPVVGRIGTRGMSAVAQVTYANTITLTPGTLSMTLEDEGIEVHALDAGLIEALASGDTARRVRSVDGD